MTDVWYAAYGSNLDPERLAIYLAMARDRRAPQASSAAAVDHQLRFGGTSQRWDGGGVAFLDPAPGTGRALVRQWLLDVDQLADVYAQENGHPVGAAALDLAGLEAAGQLDALPGRYGRLVHLGHHHGRAVVTFTAAEPPAETSPSGRYLTRLATGLRDGHGLDDAAIVSYLLAAPGVRIGWTGEELVAAVLHGSG